MVGLTVTEQQYLSTAPEHSGAKGQIQNHTGEQLASRLTGVRDNERKKKGRLRSICKQPNWRHA